jgi:O-antigen ligase
LAALVFQKPGPWKLFNRVFVWIFAVGALNAIVQYFLGLDLIRGNEPLPATAGLRVTGAFKTYGLCAAFFAVTIPYAAAAALTSKWFSRRQAGWALLTALGLITLFLTRSRGAMLAFLLGILITLALLRHFRVLAFLAVLAVAGFFILPRGMVIHLDAEGKEQSLVERFTLWDRALQVVKAKPWTGTGINTYAAVHDRYDRRQDWRVRGYYAHNGYLQLAAETGLISLGAFLFFLAVWFARQTKDLRAGPGVSGRRFGLVAGVTVFLLLALVDTVVHNPLAVMTFWFLLGAALGHRRAFPRRQAEP